MTWRVFERRERTCGPLRRQPDRSIRQHPWKTQTRGFAMHGIIYLVGLVVVILAILSFLGLH